MPAGTRKPSRLRLQFDFRFSRKADPGLRPGRERSSLGMA
jgi:hypothetical protein